MIDWEYDSKKFLYKIKKWGTLHPEVRFLLYTDHSTDNIKNPPFDYTVSAVVNDCYEFTRKLYWVNFFGQSASHGLTGDEEKQVVLVDYANGLKVKFVLFESDQPLKNASGKYSKVLVDKLL
ncbi:hypothetical protein LCGC14_1061160 [marine sediment metagenome]|uniref:Uncharacterized protein n=2 Tax=root TaxID=1 RepID=A0A831QJP4_9FLAO|nr:hypothetical protein [Pricia antarctica]